jgi:hypothetical protein
MINNHDASGRTNELRGMAQALCGSAEMKVPIAEDSATPRVMLERALVGLGHECIVAEDGAWLGSCTSAMGPTW